MKVAKFKVLGGCVLAALCGGFAVSAAIAEDVRVASNDTVWQKANVATVENYVIPRYESLAEEAAKLARSSQAFCDNPQATSLSNAQQTFHTTMDAWQGIQHIRFGPIETLMRNYSMQFWPDKKNHVGKRLNKLIGSKDAAQLQGDTFYQVPVSVRGLPAIERILFDDAVIDKVEQDTFRCAVLVRISAYVQEMGEGIAKEWKSDMAVHYQEVGSEEGGFATHQEAALAFLKPTLEQLEVIRDLKLGRPMASRIEKAKFKRLESWRSQRSLKNIKINIEALRQSVEANAIYLILFTEQERRDIAAKFSEIEKKLADIKEPIETSISQAKSYHQLNEVADAVSQLHVQLESTLSHHKLFLGFNSRDGD